MTLERKPSLLFDEYEQSVTKNLSSVSLNKYLVNLNDINTNLHLDDIDMLPLDTKFDTQIEIGKPMYLDKIDGDNEEIRASRMNNYGSSTRSVRSLKLYSDYDFNDCESFANEGFKFFFQNVVSKRNSYILNSLQDSTRNIKYDCKKWLLYPKPRNKNKRNYMYKCKDMETKGKKRMPQLLNKKMKYTSQYFNLNTFANIPFVVPNNKNNNNIDYNESDDSNNYQNYRYIFEEETILDRFQTFQNDFEYLVTMTNSSNFNLVSSKRLNYLLEKYKLYQQLNSNKEIIKMKEVPHRDFYNIIKIDNNFHLNSGISVQQLNEFIQSKLLLEPNKIVYYTNDGEYLTLRNIFDKFNFNNLKIIDDDYLEWYKNIYLPNFHILYNQNKIKSLLNDKQIFYYLLSRIFLEFHNFIDGEYLSQLLKKYIFHPSENSKYQVLQISVSYQFFLENGSTSENENWWNSFAHWLVRWKLLSNNIRWNIQIPRCFTKLFNLKLINNFQQYLDLIFNPILNNRRHDLTERLELEFFLTQTVSIDLITSDHDETLWKCFNSTERCLPKNWSNKGDNPPIAYYMFYVYENLKKLNIQRYRNKQNVFFFRNNCLKSSDIITSQFSSKINCTENIESLVCNLLLCNGGLLNVENIWDSPHSLLYLFYLLQIPCIAQPLSSTSPVGILNEFDHRDVLPKLDLQRRDIVLDSNLRYTQNPFIKLFQIGLKISISTNSVLFNRSFTSEPLIEEYSIARNIHLLNPSELTELCRNSVLMSGFEGWYKKEWLGIVIDRTLFTRETLGYVDRWYDIMNDTAIKHNVPLIRRQYRNRTIELEWQFLDSI